MTLLKSDLLSKLPRPARWGILIIVSAAFSGLLAWLRLPAGLLLGPMFAGILIENSGGDIRVPRLPLDFTQAIIGCMIARVITLDIIHSFLRQWPLFLGYGLLVIVVSCLLGSAISRLRILPETTAIWGLLPGAASAMILIADSYGADSRLVAFMLYLRVVLVAVFASVISGLATHTSVAAPVIVVAPIHWLAFGQTLAIIAGSVVLTRVFRIRAGMIMVPLFVGAALQVSGLVEVELPRWLLAASYLFLGWSIGLRFTPKLLISATRALPQILVSILAMILFCAGCGLALVVLLGIEPLTAYLATSPGGADSVAVIAASTSVDVGFVMTLQISRTLLVLLVGPIVSRFAADRIKSAAMPRSPKDT
jgi:uncharacterized protein